MSGCPAGHQTGSVRASSEAMGLGWVCCVGSPQGFKHWKIAEDAGAEAQPSLSLRGGVRRRSNRFVLWNLLPPGDGVKLHGYSTDSEMMLYAEDGEGPSRESTKVDPHQIRTTSQFGSVGHAYTIANKGDPNGATRPDHRPQDQLPPIR